MWGVGIASGGGDLGEVLRVTVAPLGLRSVLWTGYRGLRPWLLTWAPLGPECGRIQVSFEVPHATCCFVLSLQRSTRQ